MEHLVLKVLTFDVAVPTTNWFCDHYLTSCDADNKVKALAMVIIFISRAYKNDPQMF